jgi:class 3 adenylate cyclase
MGMHIGSPELKANPLTGRADYYGPMVNKSSRICTLAQGGQVLVSEGVYQAVKNTDLMKNSSAHNIGKCILEAIEILLEITIMTIGCYRVDSDPQ